MARGKDPPEGSKASRRPGDSSALAADYRRQAELSRAMAGRAASAAERSEWLKLAVHWDTLADLCERFGLPLKRPPSS